VKSTEYVESEAPFQIVHGLTIKEIWRSRGVLRKGGAEVTPAKSFGRIMQDAQRVAGAIWRAACRKDAEREEQEEMGKAKPRGEKEETEQRKFERAWVDTGIAVLTREGMCPVVLRGRGRGA